MRMSLEERKVTQTSSFFYSPKVKMTICLEMREPHLLRPCLLLEPHCQSKATTMKMLLGGLRLSFVSNPSYFNSIV